MRATLLIYLLFKTYLTVGQSGELRGKVIDAENNDPVPFANIVVEGTQIGSTSDMDGNFIITGLMPGFIKLRVSFIGYKTQLSQDILLSNNNVPYIEINLERDIRQLEAAVIKVDRFIKKQEAPLSMQSIGLKEIESNAGSNRDISRVIQSFPGVGSTPAYRNDVIIRGGGPSENRFFLDGVEIPVLNHFSTQGASGGPVGIINADFIQSVDFYSGSFPANKYNALSGILDFKQKEGSREKTNLQGAIGASEASLTIDGPIGKNTSYIFSVRRSYLQFLFSTLKLPFLPTFNDYQFKVKTDINKKNQITIISLGSLDLLALNDNIDNPDPSQEYILSQIPVNNQWSYTIGGVYKHFIGTGNHTLVLSRNMLNNEFYKYPDNNENLNRVFDYLSSEQENKFRYELTFRKNSVKYNLGLNLEYARYFNDTYQQLLINDSLIGLRYKTDFNLYKYGLFAQASKRFFNNRLLVSFGIRADANNYNDKMLGLDRQFSPRLSLSYKLTKFMFVNFGGGRFFQLPAYTTLGYRDNSGLLVNKEVSKYVGANHLNAGVEFRISESSIFSVEGFYKDYFQYPIDLVVGASIANQGADYSSIVGVAPASFAGKGKAVGLEILSRVSIEGFSLLSSYTFVRSRFTDISGKYIPSSWDSKHLLSITAYKDLEQNWRLGMKWRFVGGLPYTPYDLETSKNVQAWNARGQAYLDYSQLNTLRNKPFHQLDLRVDKNFFFQKWALMLYLDIQNAYNFKSTAQDFIIRKKNRDGTYLTLNNGSEYQLENAPNESGTILPTIGIMIKL